MITLTNCASTPALKDCFYPVLNEKTGLYDMVEAHLSMVQAWALGRRLPYGTVLCDGKYEGK